MNSGVLRLARGLDIAPSFALHLIDLASLFVRQRKRAYQDAGNFGPELPQINRTNFLEGWDG